MKFSKYLKNNYLIILLFIVIIAIIDLMLISFKTNNQAIIGVTITGVLGFILYLIYDFYRRKKFYDKFINDLDLLDAGAYTRTDKRGRTQTPQTCLESYLLET